MCGSEEGGGESESLETTLSVVLTKRLCSLLSKEKYSNGGFYGSS